MENSKNGFVKKLKFHKLFKILKTKSVMNLISISLMISVIVLITSLGVMSASFASMDREVVFDLSTRYTEMFSTDASCKYNSLEVDGVVYRYLDQYEEALETSCNNYCTTLNGTNNNFTCGDQSRVSCECNLINVNIVESDLLTELQFNNFNCNPCDSISIIV